MSNRVIDTYSELARRYDDEQNLHSCWGRAAARAVKSVSVRSGDQRVVDVGCGTGGALAQFASEHPGVDFTGIEPAEGMRRRAASATEAYDNVRIMEGSFEELPLESQSVDHLYSVFAFHWTTDVEGSVAELARVLKDDGVMELFFIGRANGREFVRVTSPIFLKYLGPKGLLEAAQLRKQLTVDEAREAFASAFGRSRLEVSERFDRYFDTLEGHWAWWVRIEGQFVSIPPDRRLACDEEVKGAISSLRTDRGIPYTLHELCVRVGPG